jgi:hypothetical protein
MNFQLHLPHGFLLFALLAFGVSVVGYHGSKLLTRKSSGSKSDDSQGEAFGAFFLAALGALATVVAVVMAFTTPYAAYAALVAVFFFSAAVQVGKSATN